MHRLRPWSGSGRASSPQHSCTRARWQIEAVCLGRHNVCAPPSSLTHVNLERQDEASGKDQVHFAELRPSLEVNVVAYIPPSSLRPATGLRRTGGSSDTYQFARAYSLSPVVDRQRVLALAAFGGADTHAIAEVVQAEVSLMRSFDDELRAIPASELESAIHR